MRRRECSPVLNDDEGWRKVRTGVRLLDLAAWRFSVNLTRTISAGRKARTRA